MIITPRRARTALFHNTPNDRRISYIIKFNKEFIR
jgi:hypothetical protein